MRLIIAYTTRRDAFLVKGISGNGAPQGTVAQYATSVNYEAPCVQEFKRHDTVAGKEGDALYGIKLSLRIYEGVPRGCAGKCKRESEEKGDRRAREREGEWE